MRYTTPDLNLVVVDELIAKQQNGSPASVPLNPECTPGACVDGPFTGALCSFGNGDIFIEAHYFLPDQECAPGLACSVIVNSQELNCVNRCDNETCNRVPGAAIFCSGVLQDVPQGCSGVDIEVVCADANDSDVCSSPAS